MSKFKHMGESGFPHGDSVDVYKYTNDFDYERYNARQMTITVCNVPWDIGEAHIGQRTISGIGNVVYFDNKSKRDEYFANLANKFTFETKYKELHKDLRILIPLPFDVLSKYNYIWVEYDTFANSDSLVEYEDPDGVNKWGYFVRNAKMIAPNTTEVELLEDVWQTFIYDVEIGGMILERGHAPMFDVSVDKYLSNPLENSDMLTTEDVSFGEIQKVASSQAMSLNNDDMRAVIVASTWLFSEAWDSDYTPAKPLNTVSGTSSYSLYAAEVYELANLIEYWENNKRANFVESIKCVFFIEAKFLMLGESQKFHTYTVYEVIGNSAIKKSLAHFTKKDFRYDSQYADIAKLYTFPYCALEISDETGNVSLVKLEETNNNLDCCVTANLIYPYINFSGVIGGIGGDSEVSVKFANIDEHSFTGSGRWYQHLQNWDIPLFGVVLEHAKYYDYATNYDRVQMLNDASTQRGVGQNNSENRKKISERDIENRKTEAVAEQYTAKDNADRTADAAYTTTENAAKYAKKIAKRNADNEQKNSNASAKTAKTNTDNSALADKKNQDNSADVITENATAQTTANDTNCTKAKEAATSDNNLSNSLQEAINNWSNGYTEDTTNDQIQAEWQQANISMASSVGSSITSGAVSGISAGVIGAVVGGVAGLFTGGIAAATTWAQTGVSTNLTSTIAAKTVELNNTKLESTTKNNTERTDTANNAKDGQKNAANEMTSTCAANSAAAAKENATRSYTVATTNSTNLRDLAVDTINLNNRTTADTNADDNYTVAEANATTTQKAQKDNNKGTFNTTGDNIERTYQTAIDDKDDNYNNEQTNINKVFNNDRERIKNLINQANLVKPLEIGSFENGESAVTKPIALFANLVTQSAANIARAGDEMLRFGYMLDRQYKFTKWNVGRYFTYWKLKDYWIKDNTIADYYQDAIRFFLMGGVTVWADPSKIGKVSIYDNLELEE